MKKKFSKLIALMLCTMLVFSIVGVSIYAMNSDKGDQKEKSNTTAVVSEINTEIFKDETVYVMAGAQGEIKKIIVSDWIKNVLENNSISDKSELSDIENIKGEETYTLNSDNMNVWDAQGNDIYYQGVIEKELPVDMNVTYTLNGNSISPAELAGKSGKITIRFEYKNNQYKTVEINGKQEKIYVPFAILTGMLLDNDVFTNINVSNGRLINDGNHTTVVGIAFPGLQSNLNISADKFEIPEYVEIMADVNNFEIMNTMTIVTNEVFNHLDTEKINFQDNLNDSLFNLNSAMSSLMDGSSQLYDGLCTLLEKSGKLAESINQLAGGLNELTSNNDTLNAGSKNVFDSLLAMADEQLNSAGLTVPKLTINNYAEVINGVLASLNAVNTESQAQPAIMKISALKAQLDSYNEFYIGLSKYTAGVSNIKDGALKLKSSVPSLTDGITELRDGAMKLSAGLKEFNEEGIQKLVNVMDGDIGSLTVRIKATADVSKDYKSFAGISDDMDGQVKFIYRTEEIKVK